MFNKIGVEKNKMDSNHKLRKIMIALIAAIGATYTLHAKAIGLGDIQVNSHLGEPLSATIPVMGILKTSDVDCFRVNSDASSTELFGTRFKLTNLVGENATLVLNTQQAINEPIANLSIIAECQTQPKIARDYIILVDPNTSNISTAEIAPQNSFNNQSVANNNSAQNSQFESDSTNVADAPIKKSRNKVKQRRSKSNASANKPMVADKTIDLKYPELATNQKTIRTPDPVTTPAKAAGTRLSISSGAGDFLASGSANINLVLEKRLDLSRAAPVGANAADIDMQDEVTVMNKRLTHLQTQMTGLQTRNLELEAKNKLQVAEIEQATEQSNLFRKITYAVGLAGLLTAGYFAADWWRRRKQTKALHNEETAWLSLSKESDLQEDAHLKSISEKTDTEFDDFEDTIDSGFGTEVTYVKEEAPEDDILDHADVFLAHGRSTLAIQLLQNHLDERPKDSANIWLFLLDLLAKEGLEEEYNVTTAECRKHFNVAIPAFAAPRGNPNSFESYDRLVMQLQKVWGTPEATKFLDDLIYNTRLEPRIGFEKEVFEELVLLRSIAIEEEKSAEVIHFQDKKDARDELKQSLNTKTAQQVSLVNVANEVPTLPGIETKFLIKDDPFSGNLATLDTPNFAPDLDFELEPIKQVASKNIDAPLFENGFEFDLEDIKTSALR